MVALDARTGTEIWKSYTIVEEPRPTKKRCRGHPTLRAIGAAVWSAPTIDAERQTLYVATGNSYSNPPADTSDAVIALDLKTGAQLWHQQATPGDSYIVGCYGSEWLNCPDNHGPDQDFAQSPVLVTLTDGRRLLVIGRNPGGPRDTPTSKAKSCGRHALAKRPARGSCGDRPSTRIMSISPTPTSDFCPAVWRSLTHAPCGLFSLELTSGKTAWKVPPFNCGAREQCSPALSAAVTVIPGVVFSGGVSGYLRAYATIDGSLLWEFDTAREYKTVNGVAARGGAMEGPGPTIAGGMLYVNSGYGVWGGLSGNVLLAFSVKDDCNSLTIDRSFSTPAPTHTASTSPIRPRMSSRSSRPVSASKLTS